MSWFEVEARPNRIYHIREPAMGPLDACNIWLILGERSALLIDAGIGVSPLRPVVEAITDLPVALLLTHSHFDHIGGAHEFADRRMHRAEAEVLADPTPERTQWGGWLTAASFARTPYPGFDMSRYALTPAPPTQTVGEGDIVDLGGRSLEILHMPGHSPGLLCVHEAATRTLFSSDALYDGPMFFDLVGSDRAAARASLQRLRALAPERLYPGHFRDLDADDLPRVCAAAEALARG